MAKRFQSRGNESEGYVAYDTLLHAISNVVWAERAAAAQEADQLNLALLADYSVGELQAELAKRSHSLPNYAYYIARTREVKEGYTSEWEAIQAGYQRYCQIEYQTVTHLRLTMGFESYAKYVDSHKKTYTKADGTSFAMFLNDSPYPDVLAYEVIT